MSRKMWAVVISMIAFFVSASNAAVVFGPIESPVNGHFYSVLSNSNWTDAEAASEQMGGSLATIRSAAEQTWISQTFSAYPYLWLGLYDPRSKTSPGRLTPTTSSGRMAKPLRIETGTAENRTTSTAESIGPNWFSPIHRRSARANGMTCTTTPTPPTIRIPMDRITGSPKLFRNQCHSAA